MIKSSSAKSSSAKSSSAKPSSAKPSSNQFVIYAALVGDVLVAVTKFVAAGVTGSSSMLSEGVHSLVDSSNQVLLLYGDHRARLPPDPAHPLGHGRELYFWSFVVSLLIFTLGAGVSAYEGVEHILHPRPIESFTVNYVVLALSFLFDGASWVVGYREFRKAKGERTLLEAAKASKDPSLFLVVFEDSAAVVGVVIAAVGSLSVQLTGLLWLDGVASCLIALVLGATAVFLSGESKALLIGERADGELVASIRRILEEDDLVADANGVMSVQMAPDQVIVMLSLGFEEALRTRDIEARIEALEEQIRGRHPEVKALFVKPQRRETYEARLRDEYGREPHEVLQAELDGGQGV